MLKNILCFYAVIMKIKLFFPLIALLLAGCSADETSSQTVVQPVFDCNANGTAAKVVTAVNNVIYGNSWNDTEDDNLFDGESIDFVFETIDDNICDYSFSANREGIKNLYKWRVNLNSETVEPLTESARLISD